MPPTGLQRTKTATECHHSKQCGCRCGSQPHKDTGIRPCGGEDDAAGHSHDIKQNPAFGNECYDGFPLAFDQGFA